MCKRYVCFLIAFCLILCLSSCTFSDPTKEKGNTAAESEKSSEPPQNSAVLEDEPACLRIRAVGTEVPVGGFSGNVTHLWIWDTICDGLLHMKPDEPGKISGCLAESWLHSDDWLIWTFNIKENVYFSDGTVCDAFSICKFLDIYGEYEGWYDYCNIVKWYADNACELVIVLSEPCPWFETELCQRKFRIVSPTAVALYGLSDMRSAVGTGPYVISDYAFDVANNQMWIEFAANKNYHLKERYPEFDILHLDVNHSENYENGRSYEELSRMLTDGELDVVIFSDSQYDAVAKLQSEDGHTMYPYLAKGALGTTLWLNPTKCELLLNKEVRKAVCRMIDQNDLNVELYGGMGEVNSSIWISHAVSSVTYGGYYCDTEEALQLLADVGYSPEELEISVGGFSSVPLLKQISAQLEQCGVQTEVLNYDGTGTYVNNSCALNLPLYVGNDYGLMGAGIDQGYGPHTLWSKILVSSENDRPDGFSSGGYKFSWQEIYAPELYAQMCEIYESMISTPHWDEMVECSRELTRIVQEDYAALPLVQPPAFFVVRDGAEELFETFTQTSMFKWMYQ